MNPTYPITTSPGRGHEPSALLGEGLQQDPQGSQEEGESAASSRGGGCSLLCLITWCGGWCTDMCETALCLHDENVPWGSGPSNVQFRERVGAD